MSILGRVDTLLGYLDNLKVDLDAVTPLNLPSTNAANANINAPKVDANAPPQTNYHPHAGSLPAQVMDAMSKLNISVQVETHEAVIDCESHRKVIKSLKGVLIRNLLVTEKRIKKKIQYLICVPSEKGNIALKTIGKYWKVGGGLRGVSDPDVTFKVGKGSITPLAVLFDDANIVQVIIDEECRDQTLLLHPASNEATVAVRAADLERYCATYGKAVQYLDMNPFIGAAAKNTEERLKQATKEQKPQKQPQPKSGKRDKNAKNAKNGGAKGGGGDGVEKEGITCDKYTQFGDWYKEIVTKCDLIDYTDISGCYVLRPSSYFIWEQIQTFMDSEIKKLGVSNAYFPLFVSEDALKSESKHFEDFNPEVAWVTHSGDTELDKKIAVRPTSETIMYPMFARWIRSFRDLPLKLNQWCNVVRWEFSNPTPFLRTREFLWQEGHTAHATQQEADVEVKAVLDLYAATYREICAVPTIQGIKTKNETFPGADYSMTVEGYIPGSGRGIQGATSHCLGQNFGKMFKIQFLDEHNQPQIPIQNSWGFTTRSIGVMVMNHSDNKGLVLPPKVAQIQVVIIPIYDQKKIESGVIDALALQVENRLKTAAIRSYFDNRTGKNAGFKFNEWELKGIPIRIEIGARDVAKQAVMVARRDEREEKGDKLVKVSMPLDDTFVAGIEKLMLEIHENLYRKAVKARDDNIVEVSDWQAFLQQIQNGKIVLAPHCNDDTCEDLIQKETREYFASQPDLTGVGATGKAKALCIPLEQKSELSTQNVQCFHFNTCKKQAKKWILFGRSY